jgi:hypothetical protein
VNSLIERLKQVPEGERTDYDLLRANEKTNPESYLPPDRNLDDFFNEIICDKTKVLKLRKVLAAHPELINTPVNDQGWVPLVLAARANSFSSRQC